MIRLVEIQRNKGAMCFLVTKRNFTTVNFVRIHNKVACTRPHILMPVNSSHLESNEEQEKRREHDDAEIREFDQKAYTWFAPEIQRFKEEMEKDFEELMCIARLFDDTPARERLFEFCFKITQKIAILSCTLESVKEKKQETSHQEFKSKVRTRKRRR